MEVLREVESAIGQRSDGRTFIVPAYSPNAVIITNHGGERDSYDLAEGQ